MTKAMTAQEIVDKMLEKDYFSKWLGINVLAVKNGYCKLNFEVRTEMLNGFGSVHGGVLFSAADSAFAFACNTNGNITVALDVSISFTKPAKVGEILTIEAQELHFSAKIGVYDVKIFNEQQATIAIFKGTAYKTNRVIN
jgi:acyl-CoA thioesterase